MFQFEYSVFDMFRTAKCSSSGRLVHAALRYFFLVSIIAVWSTTAGCADTCTSLPEDENLDVRNMSKTLYSNQNINVKNVNLFVIVT
jgi:hypothetical protein